MAILGTQIYIGDLEVKESSIFIGDVLSSVNPRITADTLPSESLLGWLDASTYESTDSWYSREGNATASLSGSVQPSFKSDFGGIFNYTTASNSLITSTIHTIQTFTSSNYTIFVAGRYSGSSAAYHGRMLSAKDNNWLLGTYGGGGGAGATEYNNAFWPYDAITGSFTIQSGSIYDTEWRIHTAKKSLPTASYYLNGTFIAQSTNVNLIDGPENIGLNQNFGPFNELNQMDIGDVVVYNRALSDSEIQQVYDVISVRYGI